VLECIPRQLAACITAQLTIPTIGIGAGAYTDGQVLVMHDVFGLYGKLKPKFVRTVSALGETVVSVVNEFTQLVRSGAFPSEMESFTMDERDLPTE